MATPFDTAREERGETLIETETRQAAGSKGNAWTHTPTGTKYNLPMAFCATYTGNSIAEDMVAASVEMVDLLEDEEKPDGFTGVSIVEQALRNTSGVRRPSASVVKGWRNTIRTHTIYGRTFLTRRIKKCGEISKPTCDDFEKRRRDDETNDRAKEDTTDRRTPAPAEPTTLMNWQRLGFPTKAMSETIEAIADRETKPAVRKALLATLRGELVNTDLDNKETPEDEEKPATTKSQKRLKRGQLFLMYMTKGDKPLTPAKKSEKAPRAMTMLAASQGKYPLRIAYDLPHLRFPIGDGEGQGFLDGAARYRRMLHDGEVRMGPGTTQSMPKTL
jgi:hypothetical protein